MVVKSCERVGSCNVDRNGSITDSRGSFSVRDGYSRTGKRFVITRMLHVMYQSYQIRLYEGRFHVAMRRSGGDCREVVL